LPDTKCLEDIGCYSPLMPRLTNPAEIRSILEIDRPWAAYALGDLAPGFSEVSEWYRSATSDAALMLLYRAFEIPVLFTLGQAEVVDGLLEEIRAERKMYLSLRPEILPLIKKRYRVEQEAFMWRMVVTPESFRPAPRDGVERLSLADLPALRELYADGRDTGEVPDFFSPDMMENGVFYGVREGAAFAGAAGTHLVAESESVGAVGNVYTRRDRRGRGLAARVTSAVTQELLGMPLRTVALNVNQNNAAAVRVYEKLGYRRYCPFYEGLAIKD